MKDGTPYHHGDLRTALIRAGLEILKTEGSKDLSIRRAARAVGVSQAAPYRHFTNKEALLASIAQAGFVALLERLTTAVHSHLEDPLEQLCQVAIAYVGLAIEHREHYRLMFNSLDSDCALKYPELYTASKTFFLKLEEVVLNCQNKQLLRAGDPARIALLLWSAVHGMTELVANHELNYLPVSPQAPAQEMRAMVRNLLDGLQNA